MTHSDKFTLLRTILKALGLSQEAVDDLVDRVVELLSPREGRADEPTEYPYHLRDGLLSPAEHSFYMVLRNAVSDWGVIFPKVGLGELFYARSDDYAKFLSYTNKIDRKHIDFVVSDPRTLRPLAGIELDDKSHQRRDRQERDQFVEAVFGAAGLPLVRLSVRHEYGPAQLNALLRERAGIKDGAAAEAEAAPPKKQEPERPHCPQCGKEMVLRTAKKGPNQGSRFWGCPGYPECRGILKYEPEAS
jgi:hypothetical protein